MVELEHQLSLQNDPEQRLYILDKLAAHYVFTNVKRTQGLLVEQRKLLKTNINPDFELNYHLHTAFIENQLYNYSLSEIHFKYAIQILEERGTVIQQAETYIDFAGTCMNNNKTELADTFLKKAEKRLQAFPNDRIEARLICRKGYLSLLYSNYSKAAEQLLEADKIINTLSQNLELKDYYFIILIHSGLGKIFERNDEREKSVRAYLKVVNMCETMGMRTRLSWHYLNVGLGYMSLNDKESAEQYFKKAIDITDDISQYARASAYANLGYYNYEKGEDEKAIELYNRAEHLFKEKSDEDYFNFSVIENWKGKLYAEVDRPRKAKKHFESALVFANRTGDFKQIATVCGEIAFYYSGLGNYKKAYEYQLKHDSANEKYIEEVNQRKQSELEIKYESEKRVHETERLKLEASKLQLKALRAQMNPHFMYNALNSIQNYITSKDTDSATKYLAKFAKLMRQSLDYSELEIIALEEEIEFIKDYLFINEKLRFEDQLKYEVNVDEELEEDIMGVPTMIIQPYVENALEHGLRSIKSGIVKVNFSLFNEETILCLVEDNGIGRELARKMKEQDPQYHNHRSRGTNITEKRLKILNNLRGEKGIFVNTIDVKDEKNGGKSLGTRVEIKIPIKDIPIKKW
ncbi:MAG: hypothetical protein GY705_18155 [Bacteroidetes bacterium]|nr:hypothetical protein [Bacteroidota bacterium]